MLDKKIKIIFPALILFFAPSFFLYGEGMGNFDGTLALEENAMLMEKTAASVGTGSIFERTFALEASTPQPEKSTGKNQDITFESSQNNFFWKQASVWDYTFSLAEVLAINTFVKEFAIIGLGQDWIETSRQTVKTSLTSPWIWDNSSFRKNQIFHTYFGNMYFTSARSNGMGFLQSLLFTGAGSFCWETFQEAGNISLNDFITTTFAGAVLGEQLFRLSQVAYSLNKPLSFLISPLSFFNNAVRQKNYQDTSSDIYSMEVYTKAGSLFSKNQSMQNLNSESETFQKDEVNAFADFSLDIIYKNPFGHTSKELMDQFETFISLSKDFSGYKIKANFDSTIFSVATGDSLKKDSSLGISYNYDITYSSRYWLSKNSAGIFFKEKINFSKSNLAWGLEGDFIFLGVTDNNLQTNENLLKPKTYTYTNGPEIKFFATYQNETAGDFSLKADIFYLFSCPESGQTLLPDGNFFVLTAAASYSHKIISKFSLGLSLEYFTKIQTASKNINSSLSENEFSVSAFAKYSL